MKVIMVMIIIIRVIEAMMIVPPVGLTNYLFICNYIMKILVINDINDITTSKITHFSLDKGYHLAKGLSELQNVVYFLTTGSSRVSNNINLINDNEITNIFLNTIDLLILVRETILAQVFEKYNLIYEHIMNKNKKTKILVKSDSIQWLLDKEFRKYIASKAKQNSINFANENIDYICVQTLEFREIAVNNKIKSEKIITSNMAISEDLILSKKECNNPYTTSHDYCTNSKNILTHGKALIPNYYIHNPNEISGFNKKRKIIIYTGRIKTDGGKILFLMKDIMEELGDDYELHIFPGSFLMPEENEKSMACSATNGNHLFLLRDKMFYNSKNVIIHYPYEHKDMSNYLNHAHCGIDFSDVRPRNEISKAGHAKILEYCAHGLPIVTEDNINNLFLIKESNNGIIIPYLSSAKAYAAAVRQLDEIYFDREQVSKNITAKHNWKIRAEELLKKLNIDSAGMCN